MGQGNLYNIEYVSSQAISGGHITTGYEPDAGNDVINKTYGDANYIGAATLAGNLVGNLSGASYAYGLQDMDFISSQAVSGGAYKNIAMPADYIVDLDGSIYYARNGSDGSVDSQDTSARKVIQYAIDNCPSGTVFVATDVVLDGGVSGANSVILDWGRHSITPTTAFEGNSDSTPKPLIYMKPGFQTYNGNIHTNGINFSGCTGILIHGQERYGSGVNPEKRRTKAQGFNLYGVYNSGTAVYTYSNGTNQEIGFIFVNDMTIYGYRYGLRTYLYEQASPVGNSWINSNTYKNCSMQRCRFGIVLERSPANGQQFPEMNANVYDGMTFQNYSGHPFFKNIKTDGVENQFLNVVSWDPSKNKVYETTTDARRCMFTGRGGFHNAAGATDAFAPSGSYHTVWNHNLKCLNIPQIAGPRSGAYLAEINEPYRENVYMSSNVGLTLRATDDKRYDVPCIKLIPYRGIDFFSYAGIADNEFRFLQAVDREILRLDHASNQPYASWWGPAVAASGVKIMANSANDNPYIYLSGGSNYRVGVNTLKPAATLHVAGDVSSQTGLWTHFVSANNTNITATMGGTLTSNLDGDSYTYGLDNMDFVSSQAISGGSIIGDLHMPYDYNIYKIGSTYYAKKMSDGSIVDSNATLETVLNSVSADITTAATIGFNGDTTYTFNGGTVTFTDKLVYIDGNFAEFDIDNSDCTVFCWRKDGFSNHMHGGIKNVHVNGDYTNTNQIFANFSSCAAYIQNVTTRNLDTRAVYNPIRINDNGVHSTIRDCFLYGVYPIRILDSGDAGEASRTLIDHCHIGGWTNNVANIGIQIQETQNLSIVNCHFTQNDICISAATGTISDMRIQNCSFAGFSSQAITVDSTRSIISDNIFKTGASGSTYITLRNTTGGIISDNIFQANVNGVTCIHTLTTKQLTVVGNDVNYSNSNDNSTFIHQDDSDGGYGNWWTVANNNIHGVNPQSGTAMIFEDIRNSYIHDNVIACSDGDPSYGSTPWLVGGNYNITYDGGLREGINVIIDGYVSANSAHTAFMGETIVANATAGAFTITLPEYHTYRGKNTAITVKKIDASNDVTIAAGGSDTIDGNSSYILANQYDTVTIFSDGLNWYTINPSSAAGGGGISAVVDDTAPQLGGHLDGQSTYGIHDVVSLSSQTISGSWTTPLFQSKPTAGDHQGEIIRVSGGTGEATWVFMSVKDSNNDWNWMQIGYTQ